MPEDNALIPLTRPMTKGDYETIFRLLEAGTPREAILAGYPIKAHTLNLRIAKDRPELWARLKSLPTNKQVNSNQAAVAAAIIEATGRIMKVDLTEVIGHDIGVLAADVRRQKAEKVKDPHKVLKPVGLPHARGILALAKVASMIPGTGLEGGGGGITINNNNTANHATVMRRGGGDIFADDDEIQEAIVVEQEDLNG